MVAMPVVDAVPVVAVAVPVVAVLVTMVAMPVVDAVPVVVAMPMPVVVAMPMPVVVAVVADREASQVKVRVVLTLIFIIIGRVGRVDIIVIS
jgi:hypothetical protein